MAILKPNNILFLLVVVIICLIDLPGYSCTDDHPSRLFKKYHVHIISNFSEDSPPLLVHCKSKDDDLGAMFLLPKQEYLIRFEIDYLKRTRFKCEVGRGKVKMEFDAFRCNRDERRCNSGNCYWSIGPDGFYFSKNKQNWQKEREYDWPPPSTQ